MAARAKPRPTWEAYDFTITLGQDIFRCKPMECFHVDGFNIVMYQLSLNAELEATIPYYVSQGGMNEVRANMLFPFMNFSIKEVDDPTCPTSFASHLSNHGLLKYGIIYNMSKKLDEELKQTFLSSGHSEEQYNKLSMNGVKSIFSRWSNILDFIIGCCTPMIINFDVSNITCYFPQEPPNEYNPKSCKEYYYSPETNIFRIKLLEKIKAFQVELFEKLNITVMPHMLPIQEQTVYQFNEMLNICHKKYQFTLSRYRNISDKLAELATPLFPEYIIPNTTPILTDLLQLNMKKWKATCTPTSIPRSYLVSNESSQIQLDPIPNLKKYRVADNDITSTIESSITSIPDAKLNATLSALLSNIKQVSCKEGLSIEQASQIRDQVLEYKQQHPQEPIFLYMYWSFVVSLFSEEIFRLHNDVTDISYLHFLVGGEERYIWLKEFFSTLHDAGVTITFFLTYKVTNDISVNFFGSFIKSKRVDNVNKNSVINKVILDDISQFLGRKKTRTTRKTRKTRKMKYKKKTRTTRKKTKINTMKQKNKKKDNDKNGRSSDKRNKRL
jgi:hypothetical protein